MSEKPTTAFALSLLSGLMILVGSILWTMLGTLLAFFFGLGFLLYAFLFFGIIILIGAAMMYMNPRSTRMWGIVILLLGLFSLVGVTTTLGGVLAIIGGALALAWNPTRTAASMPPPPPTDTGAYCPTCHGQIRYIQEYQRWYCDREQKYV